MKSSNKRLLSLFLRIFIIIIIILFTVPLLYYGYIYGSGYLKGVSVKITVTPEVVPNSNQTGEQLPLATPPPVQSVKGIHLEPKLEGLELPTFLTHAYDDRLFIVEKNGRILIAHNWVLEETPFLDIQDLVGSEGSEQGLLSIAFHPEHKNNGRFFINYTNLEGHTIIARYQVQPDNPNIADESTASILMTIGQPFAVHNGGLLAFGPDGFLYASIGDGGTSGDFFSNAQNNSNLLGTMLRLDIDYADPYAIPADNPFTTNDDIRNEIWSYGLRNPWRFSFDTLTGDLFIADVGQFEWEEINFQEATSPGGQNYGWDILEASHCYNKDECEDIGFIHPISEYSHKEGGCAITGGYVYRGTQYPALAGIYFFADYCTGKIWGLVPAKNGNWQKSELLDTDQLFSSFGQDQMGELYILGFNSGTVFQLQSQTSQ